MTGLAEEDGLFEIEAPPPVSLADRFGMPPFSVLDRRAGPWQERRRRWLSLGIRSELGRDGGLIAEDGTGYVQATVPMEQRSDEVLQRCALGSSREAVRAREILERRERGEVRRPMAAAPAPGGKGGGAWLGKTAGGASRPEDPKWDKGTPTRLIPGAQGPGAYDRSRGGTLARPNPDNATTDAAMTARPLSSGGAFMTAEERMTRERLNAAGATRDQDKLNAITGQETISGTSIFDPVLCELAYRWFCPPGGRVLDPFAGGSVRGLVAAMLERTYLGVDLRPEQVVANREQVALLPEPLRRWAPKWAVGDSREVLRRLPDSSVDMVFSCPPYADLEVYSDDPRDLSTMTYEEFLAAHDEVVSEACRTLRQDRFAAWVISDVRDGKRGGRYRRLHHRAVESFEKAGLTLYNEQVILDPVGSAAVRAGRIFNGMSKTTRMHQFMFVFVKGDPKRATLALAAERAEETDG